MWRASRALLDIVTDVELVTKVSDADRCELGAYESEYPVRSDSGGCTSGLELSLCSCLDISRGLYLARIAKELISA